MENVLITGGAGFIGSHLTERLLELGHNVTVVDNLASNIERNLKAHDNLKIVNEDITSPIAQSKIGLSFKDVTYVVHLAAKADIVPSIENPKEYHRTNVGGTINILELARKYNVKKFIYAASGSCYGDKPPVPTPETTPINCKYPYALTKYMGELACLHWAELYKLPVISLLTDCLLANPRVESPA